MSLSFRELDACERRISAMGFRRRRATERDWSIYFFLSLVGRKEGEILRVTISSMVVVSKW